MNILYLIGNGFDINLGLKTKYIDFYNYYQKIQNNDIRIKKLKENLSSKNELWSDLELAFGEYTKNINDLADFDFIFEDIVDELICYLETVESSFLQKKSLIDLNKVISDFISPETYLRLADKRNIISFKNSIKSNINNIDIITFNYTQTIENILDPMILSKTLDHENKKYRFRKIQHIHGTLTDRTVLGVNDISQISNDDFKKNLDIIESLVKPQCNKVQKHDIDTECKKMIREAQLICIFGSSIGKSDQLWWDLISNQIIKDKCKVIIFNKSKLISNIRPHKQSRLERVQRDLFVKDMKDTIGNENILFSYNSKMFDFYKEDEKMKHNELLKQSVGMS